MKLLRLKGRINQIDNGVLLVSGKKGTEIYRVPAEAFPEAIEGDSIDCTVFPGFRPDSLCRVVSKKEKKVDKNPTKSVFSAMVRAMMKTRGKIDERLRELERLGDFENEEIDDLNEKVVFIDQGIRIFNR